jgi:uncharacterized SAM-binding protein YcdF (DUF218 family)
LDPLTIGRLDWAIRVLDGTARGRLALTGGFGPHFNRSARPHAEYCRDYVVHRGVPRERVLGLIESRNTEEDARLLRSLIESAAVRQIRLVTSDFHMARSEWIFRRVHPGLELSLHPAPTDPAATRGLWQSEREKLAWLETHGLSPEAAYGPVDKDAVALFRT